MKYKKVSGERVVAAILDMIFVNIIEFIPMVIIILIFMFSSGGDPIDFLRSYMLSDNVENVQQFSITLQWVTISITFVIGVLYFALLPFKWNGQTIGKKIMKIKAINEFGDNPSFWKHFVRAVQNWSAYVALIMLPLLALDFLVYSLVSGLITTMVSGLVFVSFIVLLARSDGRGLHDMLAGTYVVLATENPEQEFIEKTTQMSDWADVSYNSDDSQDEWDSTPEHKKDDEWE